MVGQGCWHPKNASWRCHARSNGSTQLPLPPHPSLGPDPAPVPSPASPNPAWPRAGGTRPLRPRSARGARGGFQAWCLGVTGDWQSGRGCKQDVQPPCLDSKTVCKTSQRGNALAQSLRVQTTPPCHPQANAAAPQLPRSWSPGPGAAPGLSPPRQCSASPPRHPLCPG